MTRSRRAFGAGAVAAAAVAVTIAPIAASASSGARLDAVTVSGGTVTASLSAPGLPPGAGLDPGSVVVRIAGHRVAATAAQADVQQVAGTPVTAMLLVDTSGSMRGAGLSSARTALADFESAVPADIPVGLITFASAPHLALRPTTDRAALRAALAHLSAGGETALYDALAAAARAVASADPARVVVVSDGADTVSRTSLKSALSKLRGEHVSAEVVGLHTREADNAVLRSIADATGGRFVRAADGAALVDVLRSSARSYATKLLVRAKLPSGLTGSQPLVVTVDSSAGRLTAGTTLKFAAAVTPAQPSAGDSVTSPRQLLLIGLVAVALSLVLGLFALFGDDTLGRRRMKRLLGRYTAKAPEPVRYSEASTVARTALDLADRVAKSRGLEERLTHRLERAAVSLTPSEWLLLQAGVAVGGVLLFVLFGLNPVLAVVFGLVTGPALCHVYLGMRATRRRNAFVAMLPDTLQLLAGSLSAGYSLAQAMNGVVQEGSQPVAGEIGRALAESRLGVPIERTLDHVAERMQSEDFRWVVLAIQIQRQVGGSLSDVLLTVAHTMRERVQLRRHVKALSAEGRLSAYILIGLPIFLTVYMVTMRRAYIHPLYSTRFGLVMIGVGTVLMGIGSFVMKKMATVEI